MRDVSESGPVMLRNIPAITETVVFTSGGSFSISSGETYSAGIAVGLAAACEAELGTIGVSLICAEFEVRTATLLWRYAL